MKSRYVRLYLREKRQRTSHTQDILPSVAAVHQSGVGALHPSRGQEPMVTHSGCQVHRGQNFPPSS